MGSLYQLAYCFSHLGSLLSSTSDMIKIPDAAAYIQPTREMFVAFVKAIPKFLAISFQFNPFKNSSHDFSVMLKQMFNS